MDMLVGQLMNRDVKTCAPEDTLDVAAQLLWDHDVGVITVVSGARVVGMITDRDICMAAYTQGRPLRELTVSSAMSKELHSARADTPVSDAMRLLRERQIRRLPVVDEQGRLQGVLSLNDLAREGVRPRTKLAPHEVVETLAAVGQKRPAASPATNKKTLVATGA
jgi:CBS domain-containing protein